MLLGRRASANPPVAAAAVIQNIPLSMPICNHRLPPSCEGSIDDVFRDKYVLEFEVLGPSSNPPIEVQTFVDIVEGVLDDSHHSAHIACVGAERVMYRPEAQVVNPFVTLSLIHI